MLSTTSERRRIWISLSFMCYGGHGDRWWLTVSQIWTRDRKSFDIQWLTIVEIIQWPYHTADFWASEQLRRNSDSAINPSKIKMLPAVNGRGWMKACGDSRMVYHAEMPRPGGEIKGEWLRYRSAFIVVFLIGKGKARLHRDPLSWTGTRWWHMSHDPSRDQWHISIMARNSVTFRTKILHCS